MGVTTYDTSVGGLGGRPYAKEHQVMATEDAIIYAKRYGYLFGSRFKSSYQSVYYIFKILNRKNSSKALKDGK